MVCLETDENKVNWRSKSKPRKRIQMARALSDANNVGESVSFDIF